MKTSLEQYCVSGNSARIIEKQLHKQRQFDKPRKLHPRKPKPKPLAACNTGLIDKAIHELDALGIPFKKVTFLKGAAYYQLLAEVINWAAKVFDSQLYFYKPYAVAHAIRLGAKASWGIDAQGTEVLYIETRKAGVSSFHDPNGMLKRFLLELENRNFKIDSHWPHPWSRVPRQNLSFIMLSYPNVLKAVAELSRPGRVATDEEINKLILFLN